VNETDMLAMTIWGALCGFIAGFAIGRDYPRKKPKAPNETP